MATMERFITDNLWLWGLLIFLGSCVAKGIQLGLQDRFGPNIREGYRAYKREVEFWKKVNAGTAKPADPRSNDDIPPGLAP